MANGKGTMDAAAADIDSSCAANAVGSPKLPCGKDKEKLGHLRVTAKYRKGKAGTLPALESAKVHVSGPSGSLNQVTRSTGEAVFRDLKPGHYKVKASHADCVDANGNGDVVADAFAPVEVVLEPLGKIKGRVVDASNPDKKANGVSGAVVQIEGHAEKVTTSAS